MYRTQELKAEGRVRKVKFGIMMLIDVVWDGCCLCNQQMSDGMHYVLQLLHVRSLRT